MLAWDNLTTHPTAGMKTFIAEHNGLTVIQPPAHAPEPNPVEGIWPLIRRNAANSASTDSEDLIATVHRE